VSKHFNQCQTHLGQTLIKMFTVYVTNHESNHQSPITNHQSPITNHQSPITNHQSPMFKAYSTDNSQHGLPRAKVIWWVNTTGRVRQKVQSTLRQGFHLRVCADYVFIKSCDMREGNIPDLLAFVREGNYARNSARRCQLTREGNTEFLQSDLT